MVGLEGHINLCELIVGYRLRAILSHNNLGVGTTIDANKILPVIGKGDAEYHVPLADNLECFGREQLESGCYYSIIVLSLARRDERRVIAHADGSPDDRRRDVDLARASPLQGLDVGSVSILDRLENFD